MIWAELPVKVRAFIIFIAIAAAPILGWAVWDVLNAPHESGWIVITLLTVFTVPFFLRVPSVSIVGVGDAYIMAIAMIYGSSPCIIATLCHTLLTLVVQKKPKIRPYRIIFNISSFICCAWLYSSVYQMMNPTLSHQIPEIFLPAATLTIVFFFANSLLISTAIAWASQKSILDVWGKNCLPLSVDFSVSAVSATFIVSLQYINKYAPLAVAPLIGVVWGWNKLNKAKAMEAEKHLLEQEQLYLRTVESLALAVDAKDQTTYGHIRRVKAYALGLAKLCGIKESDELRAIETGSLLHDIGKIAIDDYILNKPGPLNKQEFEKMKVHSAAGDEILQQVQFPFPVAKYVRYHHERWDGLGYPDGLKGEEIPLGARILAIADAFDAIRASRPYKLSSNLQESVELLRLKAGNCYDPVLVQMFIDHVDELEAAAQEAAKNMAELSFRKYFEKIKGDFSAAIPPLPANNPHTSSVTELVRLAEFCSSHGRHLDLPDVFPIIARRLESLLPFATCAFYLDNCDESLEAAYVSGMFSNVLKNARIALGKGISGWVAAYGRPMMNTGPALEFQQIPGDFSILSDTISVPLITNDNCIGAITLYAQAPVSYAQTHLELLQAAAGQVAPLVAEIRGRSSSTADQDVLDPVTGTFRVAYLSVAASRLIAHAESSNSPLSLLALQINNFAQVTQLFGSSTANLVLRNVAEGLRSELRDSDVLARYGHQGFVAILTGVGTEQASRCAQRLKQQIRTVAVGSIPGNHIPVQCETAVASFPDDGAAFFDLLLSAQQCLAKPVDSKVARPAEGHSNIIGFPGV